MLWDEIWKSPYDNNKVLDHAPKFDEQAKCNFKLIKQAVGTRDAKDFDDDSVALIASIMSTMRQRDADVRHGLDPNWND